VLGATLALKDNRIKADTRRIISLLSAVVIFGIAISSIWASFEYGRALERFHTQLESVRVRTADMKMRTDVNAADLRRARESQQPSTAAEREHVLGLVQEASALQAEGRTLRFEIDDIRSELGEALRAKETRAFWRALIGAVAFLPSRSAHSSPPRCAPKGD